MNIPTIEIKIATDAVQAAYKTDDEQRSQSYCQLAIANALIAIALELHEMNERTDLKTVFREVPA